MENKINKEDFDKKKQQLLDELNTLMKSSPGYAEQKRIDEILDILDDMEGFPEYDVEESWNDFKTKYIDTIDETEYKVKKKTNIPKRAVIGAVAVFVSLNLITTIFAKGNIITLIYSLNKEAVKIQPENENLYTYNEDSIINFNSIEKLKEYFNGNITVMEYVPKEYKIDSIACDREKTFVSIVYSSDNGDYIDYSVRFIDPLNNSVSVENNENDFSIFTYKDKDYHIVNNNATVTIQWQTDELIYCIGGNLTEDDIIKIIKNLK